MTSCVAHGEVFVDKWRAGHCLLQILTMSGGDCDINDVLLSKHLNVLDSEDRIKRKSALQSIKKHVFDQEERTPEELSHMFDIVGKPLIRCFSDQVESCRELAGNITHEFFKQLKPDDKHLVYLIPTLAHRLGSPERVEPSEEVRLVLVGLLREVVNRYFSLLPSYLNDVIQILAKVIVDPYPKIKKESCECSADLAKALPRHFHLQSESLIKPIIQNFTHQQYKIRVAAISSIGDVVRYGNNKSISDVIVPLAERLFDQSQVVRLAVTRVIGDWMVNLPERYSYFSRLLPVMLTSLNDQDTIIQEEAWNLWDKAGIQWLEENENDVKDKLDFLNAPPSHYPSNVRRPNLGCRTLVKRNLHNIAPALARELEDWLVDVRIKASQLLCVLVLNIERDVAQLLEQLLTAMYRASCDSEQRVVDNIERAAELLGYFAPPANFWTLMKPIVESCCHKGHLRVLANLMTGCNKDLVETAADILNFVHLPSICHSKECVFQMQVARCCCALMKTCGNDCLPFSQQLFDILISVDSIASVDAVHDKVEDGLLRLEEIVDVGSRAGLYYKYSHGLLLQVTSSADSWTVHSPERFIFQHLLSNAGPALNSDLEVVLKTLKIALSPDNPDAELKLRLMTTLATLLQSKNRHLPWTPELLENYVRPLVNDVIAPSLVWKAGRTSEALRTISIACLLSALQETEKEHPQFVASLLDNLLPVLLGLIEDPARKTRLYTCQSLLILVETTQDAKLLTAEQIHKSYFVILKRLDDVADDVRSTAVNTLRVMFRTLPEDYSIDTSFSHIEALYATMLIHLDDPGESFRTLVLDALKDLSWLKPSFLHDRLSATRSQFRNQDGCDQLLKHVASVLNSTQA